MCFGLDSELTRGTWSFLSSFKPLVCLLLVLESLLGWHNLLEAAAQIFLDAEHGTVVVELVAVVGGAEDSYQLLVCKELISIFHDLMASHYEIKIMLLKEVLNNLVAEHVGDTTLVVTPSLWDNIQDER